MKLAGYVEGDRRTPKRQADYMLKIMTLVEAVDEVRVYMNYQYHLNTKSGMANYEYWKEVKFELDGIKDIEE